MRKVLASLSASLTLIGCAASPDNITPQYVSPLMYQHYSCDQISMELQRIGARVSEVAGQQQRAANNDAVAMGVGLVIFWPALFFLANDNDKREELSRLRGEHDALQQAANMRSCFAPAAQQQLPSGQAVLTAPPQSAAPPAATYPAPAAAAPAEPMVQQPTPTTAPTTGEPTAERRSTCRPRLNSPC